MLRFKSYHHQNEITTKLVCLWGVKSESKEYLTVTRVLLRRETSFSRWAVF